MDENLNPDNEKFSDDPEENLEMENQFLKMKLMAETGAKFFESESDLPPDIMNEWLKNIAQFEASYGKEEEKTVRVILGFPDFKPSSELNDMDFAQAYERLQHLMREFNLEVSFLRERDDRFKYDFITGELFDHQTSMFPGMTTYFIYEEFHADHDLDIRNRTNEFFTSFFERRFGNPDHPYFSGELISPDGQTIPAEKLNKEFQAMYEAIPEFEDADYVIDKIDFELTTDPGSGQERGMGYSEGTVSYGLVFKNGEKKMINGPFKIYLSMEFNWWEIFFFYLAGFNLHIPEGDMQES